jgi:hypothetical protein
MDWLWGTLAGFGLGAVAGPLVEPWSRRLQRFARKAARESPVDVHVEWDQAQVWAGAPPWVSFSNYFEGGLPSEPAPADGKEWSGWAERNAGSDWRLTMLVVTVSARTDATVVMDTPRVLATRRDVPLGVGVLWPAPGGADLNPRRYDIDLSAGSPPWVSFRDDDAPRNAQPKPAPSWRLGPGDVERLHIWAKATDDAMYDWTMDLPLLVDGRRVLVRVSKAGQPFVTVGQRQPHRSLIWTGKGWSDSPHG